jgi:hypothetical protein
MDKQLGFQVCVLALVTVFAGAYAYAGELDVNIPQPFKAGGKDFPAGHYRILTDDQNDHSMNIRNLDTKTDVEIQFTTRLSPRGGSWGEVVFDKVDDALYLAEIYVVGTDGYFFRGAPGKHKHMVVREEVDKYPQGPG